MRRRLAIILLGAAFLLIGGTGAAVGAIVAVAPLALFMSGSRQALVARDEP